MLEKYDMELESMFYWFKDLCLQLRSVSANTTLSHSVCDYIYVDLQPSAPSVYITQYIDLGTMLYSLIE